MTLGQRIKAARLEKGMTQKALAGDMITRNMLSKIENGSATPSVRTLRYIADKLNMPVSAFLGEVSDGSAPDGLDAMRQAFRNGNWEACIRLLEADKESSSTDEGFLLHALARENCAREAISSRKYKYALDLCQAALYYSRETMYGGEELYARIELLMAAAQFGLDKGEYASTFANSEMHSSDALDKQLVAILQSAIALDTGRNDSAQLKFSSVTDPRYQGLYILQRARLLYADGDPTAALREIEKVGDLEDKALCRLAEKCCIAMDDYKKAYYYVTKQII